MSYPAFVGHRSHGDGVHSRIFQSHLAYLNQEETPSKLKQRHVLENLILDFLSVVPHEEKFSFSEIAMILEKSIKENPNFSACKAALAFEALERYAINLLSHPWRKEYKVVKLFSGFYKHSIENQLLGANTIFLLLGYQESDVDILFLDDLVDPDRVAIVALDCLKAYAECQILLQICEKVKGYKCTWLEIMNVRQEYTCGVDEAVRILQQLKKASFDQCKSDQWLNGQEPLYTKDAFLSDRDKSQNHLESDVLVDISSTWPSATLPSVPLPRDVLVPQSSPHSSINPTKSKNILYTHTKLPSWSETSYHTDSNKKKLGRSEGTSNVLSRSFEEQLQLTFDDSKKGFTNSNFDPSVKPVTSPVFKSSGQKNYNCFENFDLQNRDPYNFVPNSKSVFGSSQMHFFPPGHVLPSFPGYPCPLPPDLPCPHPGSLHYPMCCDQRVFPPTKTLHQKDMPQHLGFQEKTKSLDDQNLPTFLPDGSPPFCSSSLNKRNPIVKPEPFPVSSLTSITNFNTVSCQSGHIQLPSKRESFYDNVPSNFSFEAHQDPNSLSESKTLSRNPQVNGTNHFNPPAVPTKHKSQKIESGANSAFQRPTQPSHYNTNPHVNEPSQTPENAPNPKFAKSMHKEYKKWACGSCTFYNSGERNICDMCGRSKMPGPEITPLVSGGRECPQCTLVNKKGSENCTACGASLKDSPTYI